MPTYEYKCKSCGKMSEFFQSMTAKPMRKCPACGKNALDRQIGIGAAVVFKGSGFYQTDYRSESYKKAAEAESKNAPGTSNGDATAKPEPGSASKAETKAEAKPDTRSDAKPETMTGGPATAKGAIRVGGSQAKRAAKPASPAPKAGVKRRAGRA